MLCARVCHKCRPFWSLLVPTSMHSAPAMLFQGCCHAACMSFHNRHEHWTIVAAIACSTHPQHKHRAWLVRHLAVNTQQRSVAAPHAALPVVRCRNQPHHVAVTDGSSKRRINNLPRATVAGTGASLHCSVGHPVDIVPALGRHHVLVGHVAVHKVRSLALHAALLQRHSDEARHVREDANSSSRLKAGTRLLKYQGEYGHAARSRLSTAHVVWRWHHVFLYCALGLCCKAGQRRVRLA
mmetsp:Transcript_45062/g.134508  ORF Transcript_45062/g.134508 Transcript_45062/m.134508 type:complete len:239 (-) Transcript_45062:873-1589(-)